jgi:hypothetical protein
VTRNHQEFFGTEHELHALTADLDQLHNDVGMPAMRAGTAAMIDAVHSGTSVKTSDRRTFLMGITAALVGGGALLAHDWTGSRAGAATLRQMDAVRSGHAFPPAGDTGDLAVAAVAASLENLAVYTYTQGLDAALKGKLGAVPPAVATFAKTVRAQHQEHAKAWNSVLEAHHQAPVTQLNPTLAPTVMSDLKKVTNVTKLADLAITLETIAAETYQAETSMLTTPAAIALSASIEPVEMQHIAILYYVLGKYPGAQSAGGVPIAFSSTAMAV